MLRPLARLGVSAVVVWMAGFLAGPLRAANLTPESSEVQAAVRRAVRYLESDEAKGGSTGQRALVGLALLKSGANVDHPRITAGVEAIEKVIRGQEPRDIPMDIYTNGLAIIFLVALDPGKYESDIAALLTRLQAVQKPHGGWGYKDKETGDTSQTQYGVLSCWEAAQAGFPVPKPVVERVTNWLLKTQDPKGAFGYQGTIAPTDKRVKQHGVRHSMAAAGTGSLYICANLLGFSDRIERDDDIPRVLRLAKLKTDAAAPKSAVPLGLLHESQTLGNGWIAENFKINAEKWTYYYLYALERYYSFREAAEGQFGGRWYNEGARYLIHHQGSDGSWEAEELQRPAVNTSFAMLFLLRSSKKSIEHAQFYKSGSLTGGRGLPSDTSRVEMRAGRLQSRPPVKSPEALLSDLADAAQPGHAPAVQALRALPGDELAALAAAQAPRLQGLALAGPADARVVALAALARTRNLDYAPALIRALDDPDAAIVRAACQGLNMMSRGLEPVEVPDPLPEAQRQALVEKWKKWYLIVRPDAQLSGN